MAALVVRVVARVCVLVISTVGVVGVRVVERRRRHLLEAGLDAALIDPTDSNMMDTLKASEAILGADENCLTYLNYQRKN